MLGIGAVTDPIETRDLNEIAADKAMGQDCPDCGGDGWVVVARMRSRIVHGWNGEPEQRWEPEPEQEQCSSCQGTGKLISTP